MRRAGSLMFKSCTVNANENPKIIGSPLKSSIYGITSHSSPYSDLTHKIIMYALRFSMKCSILPTRHRISHAVSKPIFHQTANKSLNSKESLKPRELGILDVKLVAGGLESNPISLYATY